MDKLNPYEAPNEVDQPIERTGLRNTLLKLLGACIGMAAGVFISVVTLRLYAAFVGFPHGADQRAPLLIATAVWVFCSGSTGGTVGFFIASRLRNT